MSKPPNSKLIGEERRVVYHGDVLTPKYLHAIDERRNRIFYTKGMAYSNRVYSDVYSRRE